jgi:hypothetical protein
MVWKPKQKELTREEAVELARSELAPDWFGVRPLLAAVQGAAGVTVHPLDPAISSQPWLLFFLNPFDFHGETALALALEFRDRYSSAGSGGGLRSLALLKLDYAFQRSKGWLESFARLKKIDFPLVNDRGGLLSTAFGVRELPRLLLIDQGKTLFETQILEKRERTEHEIQRFLRGQDPGLPLPHPRRFAPEQVRNASPPSLEFGARARTLQSQPPFFAKGTWKVEDECITTEDPLAEIEFMSPGTCVSVLAKSSSQVMDTAKISVEVSGAPAFDAMRGADLSFDDEGASSAKVIEPRLYHLLKGLGPQQRKITLRFQHSARVPITLCGLRFGNIGTG